MARSPPQRGDDHRYLRRARALLPPARAEHGGQTYLDLFAAGDLVTLHAYRIGQSGTASVISNGRTAAHGSWPTGSVRREIRQHDRNRRRTATRRARLRSPSQDVNLQPTAFGVWVGHRIADSHCRAPEPTSSTPTYAANLQASGNNFTCGSKPGCGQRRRPLFVPDSECIVSAVLAHAGGRPRASAGTRASVVNRVQRAGTSIHPP